MRSNTERDHLGMGTALAKRTGHPEANFFHFFIRLYSLTFKPV